MKKNKKVILSCVVAVLVCVLVGVGAVGVMRIVKAEGGYTSKIANRVNITVDKTKFEVRTQDGDDAYGAELKFSIQKTEPDFYCKLQSVTLEGGELTNLIYTAGEFNPSSDLPENLLLGADDEGNAIKYSWDISFALPKGTETTRDLTLRVCYESGVNKESANEYETEIPIQLTINN